MSNECDACGYRPEDHSAAARRTMAECENCGRTLCDQCLMEMAVEEGMCSESVGELFRDAHGAKVFFQTCETLYVEMCPECFEGEE